MSSPPLNVVIAGGTGHAGEVLARHWREQGHFVTVLGRYPKAREWTTVHWEPPESGLWMDSLEGANVLINLVGQGAYPSRRSLQSRLTAIRTLAAAIQECSHPPALWLNSSSVAVYGNTIDEPADDFFPLRPDDFSAASTIECENEFFASPTPQTRKIALRSGLIMSPLAGGPFVRLLRLMRYGLVGRLGSGTQYISWIHDFDWLRAVDFLIAHEEMTGGVNLCSPHPVTNVEFMTQLRRAWNPLKAHLAAPGWFPFATSLMASRRATPRRLLDRGFIFDFPDWHSAAPGLIGRWRALR